MSDLTHLVSSLFDAGRRPRRTVGRSSPRCIQNGIARKAKSPTALHSGGRSVSGGAGLHSRLTSRARCYPTLASLPCLHLRQVAHPHGRRPLRAASAWERKRPADVEPTLSTCEGRRPHAARAAPRTRTSFVVGSQSSPIASMITRKCTPKSRGGNGVMPFCWHQVVYWP